MNAPPIQRIYYTRFRRRDRYLAHLAIGIFIVWAFLTLREIYQDPSYALMLIIFIPVAVYSVAWAYATSNICIITSPAGIEYKKAEFSIVAKWSQVTSVKRGAFPSILGVHHYLLLDAPILTYTKWLGTAYKLQLNHLFFPRLQKRIPLGKNLWEANEELEKEIQSQVPGLTFETL